MGACGRLGEELVRLLVGEEVQDQAIAKLRLLEQETVVGARHHCQMRVVATSSARRTAGRVGWAITKGLYRLASRLKPGRSCRALSAVTRDAD